jgi:hypothetical protein
MAHGTWDSLGGNPPLACTLRTLRMCTGAQFLRSDTGKRGLAMISIQSKG